MKRHVVLVALSLLASGLTAVASENGLAFVYQPLDSMGESGVLVCEVPLVTGGAYPEVFYEAITMPHLPQQSTPQKVEDINAASLAGIVIHATMDGQEPSGKNSVGRPKLVIEFDFSKAHPDRVNEALIAALLKCVKKTGEVRVLHSKITAGENYPKFVSMIQAVIPAEGSPALVPVNPVSGLATQEEVTRDIAVSADQGVRRELRIVASQRLSKARDGYAALQAAIHPKDSVSDFPGLLSLARPTYDEKEGMYSITLGVPPVPGHGPEQGGSPTQYDIRFSCDGMIWTVNPVTGKK